MTGTSNGRPRERPAATGIPVGMLDVGVLMDRTRRLSLSLALTAVLVVVEVAFGAVAHSSGLLADAGHNVADAGALLLSLVAVRLALRPPSAARSFGNHRATILAALANASLIAVVTVLIVFDSVHRLIHPEPVRAGIVVVVASVGLVINGLAVLVLREQVQRPQYALGGAPYGG